MGAGPSTGREIMGSSVQPLGPHVRPSTHGGWVSECVHETCPGGVACGRPRANLKQPTGCMTNKNATISYKRVYGEDNEVHADHCLIAGRKWVVHGDYNVVVGESNQVSGHGNVVLGHMNEFSGTHVFSGDDCLIRINDAERTTVCRLDAQVMTVFNTRMAMRQFHLFDDAWYHYLSKVRRMYSVGAPRGSVIPVLGIEQFDPTSRTAVNFPSGPPPQPAPPSTSSPAPSAPSAPPPAQPYVAIDPNAGSRERGVDQDIEHDHRDHLIDQIVHAQITADEALARALAESVEAVVMHGHAERRRRLHGSAHWGQHVGSRARWGTRHEDSALRAFHAGTAAGNDREQNRQPPPTPAPQVVYTARDPQPGQPECSACMTGAADMAAVPCGHVDLCGVCINPANGIKKCITCREEVTMFMRVFQGGVSE